MNERVHKSLYDIKMAIEEIDAFVVLRNKRFDEYTSDLLLKRAIERNLEIIGEAMNRILKEDANFAIENAKRIVGLRNQIIHGYDSISDENVWAVVVRHLPKLKISVEELLKQF